MMNFRALIIVYVPFVIFAITFLLAGIFLIFVQLNVIRTTGDVAVSIPFKVSGALLLAYDTFYIKWFLSKK